MSSPSIPDPINEVPQPDGEEDEAPIIAESATFGTGLITPVPRTPHDGLLEIPIGQMPLQIDAGTMVARGGDQAPYAKWYWRNDTCSSRCG